jgi:hypothetical protein
MKKCILQIKHVEFSYERVVWKQVIDMAIHPILCVVGLGLARDVRR